MTTIRNEAAIDRYDAFTWGLPTLPTALTEALNDEHNGGYHDHAPADYPLCTKCTRTTNRRAR